MIVTTLGIEKYFSFRYKTIVGFFLKDITVKTQSVGVILEI